MILRRQDGSFAATFSARGVTSEGIAEAAKRLYDKGVEQRLDRESGRYTESRRVEKVAFDPFQDHTIIASETFHTVSKEAFAEVGHEKAGAP